MDTTISLHGHLQVADVLRRIYTTRRSPRRHRPERKSNLCGPCFPLRWSTSGQGNTRSWMRFYQLRWQRDLETRLWGNLIDFSVVNCLFFKIILYLKQFDEDSKEMWKLVAELLLQYDRVWGLSQSEMVVSGKIFLVSLVFIFSK